jgi:hypothetical protein
MNKNRIYQAQARENKLTQKNENADLAKILLF